MCRSTPRLFFPGAERRPASLSRQTADCQVTKSAQIIISRIVMSSIIVGIIIIIMVYNWINEDTLLYVYSLVQ